MIPTRVSRVCCLMDLARKGSWVRKFGCLIIRGYFKCIGSSKMGKRLPQLNSSVIGPRDTHRSQYNFAIFLRDLGMLN